MDTDQGESIHFWQTAPLAGVELLSARYIEHRFAPHVHDGYVIGMIMAGAQRYRYRGAEHLAGSGTLVLINPDELHTGHKGAEDGWLYRAFYPDSAQILSLLAELELPTDTLPPHTWLMQQRIARARALLQGGCLPLEVATQLGFADQSHLSRQFKQVYGVGPGAYRSAFTRRWRCPAPDR
jgi:AraC-like DNA-binding protein